MIIDGTSTTVAFGEALVGTTQPSNQWAGNGVHNAPSGPNLYYVGTNITGIKSILQACNASWQTGNNNGQVISVNRGQYWAWGAESMSLLNTIVPPSSQSYPWGICRYGCACRSYAADHSNINNVTSAHPGGANVLFADGSVHFIKSSINMIQWWRWAHEAAGKWSAPTAIEPVQPIRILDQGLRPWRQGVTGDWFHPKTAGTGPHSASTGCRGSGVGDPRHSRLTLNAAPIGFCFASLSNLSRQRV